MQHCSKKASHLNDSCLPHMFSGWGTVKHSVAVRGPLYVTQPPWPVRVALQVGVEGDGIIARVTCKIDMHTMKDAGRGRDW